MNDWMRRLKGANKAAMAIVEAVPHDRYARADRQPEHGDGHDQDAGRHAPGDNQGADAEGGDRHHAPVGEPLELLALLAPRAPEPNDERDGRRHHGAGGHDGAHDPHYPHDGTGDAVGVRYLREVRERPGLKRQAGHTAGGPERDAPGYGPPAG